MKSSEMLKGVRVVELASVLAGPAVGMFLAELGADVIKIENKLQGGDVTRTWRIAGESNQISSYYSSINYLKELKLLDLKDAKDLDEVKSLIKDADIVISNFKPSSAEKLGLDYNSLKTLNPTIISGEIKGFARSDRPAYDAVLQAESGFMFMNGEAGYDPVKMPVALIDILAAHHLKEGILLAMIHHLKNNEGSKVTVSLEEAAIASLANQASAYLMNGTIPQRQGSLHPAIAPYGEILKFSKGEQMVLAIGNNKQLSQLCEVLKVTDCSGDYRFNNNHARVENRQALFDILNTASSKLDFTSTYNRLIELNVPVGHIKNMAEVFNSQVAQSLIREAIIEGSSTRRVGTAIFSIEH